MSDLSSSPQTEAIQNPENSDTDSFDFFDKEVQAKVKDFLSKKIDTASKLLGIKQAEIARHINNTPSQFSKKLKVKNRYPIPALEIKKIAQFCGFSLNDLLSTDPRLKMFFNDILDGNVPNEDKLYELYFAAVTSFIEHNKEMPLSQIGADKVVRMLQDYFGADAAPSAEEIELAVPKVLQQYALTALSGR